MAENEFPTGEHEGVEYATRSIPLLPTEVFQTEVQRLMAEGWEIPADKLPMATYYLVRRKGHALGAKVAIACNAQILRDGKLIDG